MTDGIFQLKQEEGEGQNLVLSWSISPSILFYASSSSFCTKINEENIVKMRTILKHKNVEQNVFLNDSTFFAAWISEKNHEK